MTYIMGRSFSGSKDKNTVASYLEDLDILSSLSDFENMSAIFENHSSEGESTLGCYGDFGFCLSSSVMMAMKEENVTEGDIMTHVAMGLSEYLTSGDIVNTWMELRKIEHVLMAAKCLKRLEMC